MMKSEISRILLSSLIAAGSLFSLQLSARPGQDSSRRIMHEDADPRYRMLELGNLWLDSSNPSAIGLRSMPDIGSAQFVGNHRSGAFRRSMDSRSVTGWGFGADRYQSLEHLNLWGTFSFAEGHHHGRSWSDNTDPYNGNPYQAGSPIEGDYLEQVFDMEFRLSSRQLFRRVWFGCGLDYSLGDFSRLNDPRSRVQFMDLAVTPGIIVELAPEHHAGLSFTYRYCKEKNNRYVAKSRNTREYDIFRHEGLGVYTPVMASDFERRNKSQWFGGQIQYEFASSAFTLMAAAGFQSRGDVIEDRIKEMPGDYAEKMLEVSVTAQWKSPRSIHLAELSFDGTSGAAHRNFQELVTEKDPVTGILVSRYETRLAARSFTRSLLTAGLSYRYIRHHGTDCLWYLGAGTGFRMQDEAYVFYDPESSLSVSSASVGMNAGVLLFSRGRHRLFLETVAGYSHHLGGELFLSPEVERHEVEEKVTRPDYDILCRNALETDLKLRYIFPLVKKLDGFVSLAGSNALSLSVDRICRTHASLAIGVLQRF